MLFLIEDTNEDSTVSTHLRFPTNLPADERKDSINKTIVATNYVEDDDGEGKKNVVGIIVVAFLVDAKDAKDAKNTKDAKDAE